MELLRTPDDRFADLPDFPFEPHYVETSDGVRVHYLEEGPADAPPVLLMHGEPTWAYLSRQVVPTLVAAGHRGIVTAPVGFGRSDKQSPPGDSPNQPAAHWIGEVLYADIGSAAGREIVGQ